MTSNQARPEPGGFLSPVLPSPPSSSITSPYNPPSTLPAPRTHPLKPSSAKESSFIDYVDRKLLDISGRYEKRHGSKVDKGPPVSGHGYESFAELATEMDSVVNIIWVSGTPSLQMPYLLNVALAVCTYLPSFDFAPRSTFQLLQKLDLVFSSLLHGRNVETGEVLPGFEGGRGKPTTTDKVRLRGLVERTRVAVVGVAGKGTSFDGSSRVTETDEDMTTDDDVTMDGTENYGDDVGWEMSIARVYERTMVHLGSALDESGNGNLL